MKKILLSLLMIATVAVGAIGATQAYFSDSVNSIGNTFATGSLDLTVDGGDVMVPFIVDNLLPGETKGSPTYTICNIGTIPGVVSLKVTNVTSNENSEISPELSSGDIPDTRIDPDGYTISSGGYGELLDQVVMRFWADDTPGQRPAPFDWQDRYWEGYPDESSTYHLPLDTDLIDGKNFILQAQACGYVGVVTNFIDDTNTPYGWILDGVKNNTAMTDDIKFDLEIGLKQVTP